MSNSCAVHIYFSEEKCLFVQDTRKNALLLAAKELAVRLNESTQWGMQEIEYTIKAPPISDDIKHSHPNAMTAKVDNAVLYATNINGLMCEILTYLFTQLLFHEDMRFSEIMTYIKNPSGETHE